MHGSSITMKIKGFIEETKLCHSTDSKDWLLRPGSNKIEMEPNVDVEVEATLQFPLEVVQIQG